MLYWEILCLHSWEISVCRFFPLWCLCRISVSGSHRPHKNCRPSLCPPLFSGRDCVCDWCDFFLKCSGHLPGDASGSGVCSCRWQVFSNERFGVRGAVSFLLEWPLVAYVLQRVCLLYRRCETYGYKLLVLSFTAALLSVESTVTSPSRARDRSRASSVPLPWLIRLEIRRSHTVFPQRQPRFQAHLSLSPVCVLFRRFLCTLLPPSCSLWG